MTESLKDILAHKSETKKKFTAKLKLAANKPLIGIILDKDLGSNDVELLVSVLEGAEELDVSVVVLKDKALPEEVEKFSGISKNVVVAEYKRIDRENLLTAADMTMSFDFNDVEEMLVNGVVPISLQRPEIQDYNPNKESGNAFVYKKKSKWSAFAALVRASETFKFPYDWKNIVRQTVER
mgnify:CR=1 FL=1